MYFSSVTPTPTLTPAFRLVPSWPVVILKRDVRFTNHDPMEVGIQYGYRYWGAKGQGQGPAPGPKTRRSLGDCLHTARQVPAP